MKDRMTRCTHISVSLLIFCLALSPLSKADAPVQKNILILVEGGPHLLGDFFAEELLDEQFLTLAPQIAGRDDSGTRPGLVAGKLLAPGHPIWATLLGVKRGGNHLFLRYAFGSVG